ncbi:RNI-like protein [Cubamyces sp. BRFM 1775]|nr:RNI-like protein [Cubamyces sp. BRFM 1775]
MSYIDELPSDEESCFYAEHLEFRLAPATPATPDGHTPPSPTPAIDDDALALLLPRCPNLTSAVLSGVPDLSSRTLHVLAASCAHLARLDLSHCASPALTDLGLHALAAQALPLTALGVSRVLGLTDGGLARAVRGLPHLAELEMDGLPLVTAVAVRDIWTFARGLRRWSLAGCVQLTDSAFPWVPESDWLRSSVGLEEEVPGASHSQQEGGSGGGDVPAAEARVQAQARGSREGSSGLSFGPPVVTSSPRAVRIRPKTWLESLPPLILPGTHKLNELRELDLGHCVRLTDAAILGVVAYAPRIHHLSLAGCIELTDRAMHAVSNLAGLTALDIAGLERVTDEGAFAVASSCRRLRVIDISFIPNLSDLVVLELASLPGLQRLGAAGLPRLTDNALCFLAEHASELEALHLPYCIRLTLDGVRTILRRLATGNTGKLEELSLTGVPALRRRGIRRFSERPPEGYDERKEGAYREFRAGNVRALGAFLEKEEWRRREAERMNIPFVPRGDDSRALY